MNNLNPRFSKHITMDFVFEAMQELKLVVFDFDKSSRHDFLVSMDFFSLGLWIQFRALFTEYHCPQGAVLHQRRPRDGHTGQFSDFEAFGQQRAETRQK